MNVRLMITVIGVATSLIAVRAVDLFGVYGITDTSQEILLAPMPNSSSQLTLATRLSQYDYDHSIHIDDEIHIEHAAGIQSLRSLVLWDMPTELAKHANELEATPAIFVKNVTHAQATTEINAWITLKPDTTQAQPIELHSRMYRNALPLMAIELVPTLPISLGVYRIRADVGRVTPSVHYVIVGNMETVASQLCFNASFKSRVDSGYTWYDLVLKGC